MNSVRGLLVLGLSAILVGLMLAPALAEDDPFAALDALAKAEMAQPQVKADSAATTGASLDTAPDQQEVLADIDTENGATESDRIQSYAAKLKTQLNSDPKNADTLARLGIALNLGGKPDTARGYLEQAVVLQPGAQSLYDELASSISAVDTGIKVYVNGKQTTFDQQPVVVNGRTLVPIRAVAEQLGAKVSWNADTATATVQVGANVVEVAKDSTDALVNGNHVTLDVAATIMNGRTLLPLRFVSESLGEQVGWHPADNASVVSITDP